MTPALLLFAACGPKDPILHPDRVGFDFLIVDDGNDQLHRVDELRGHDWTTDLPPGTRDLIRWDDEHVLASHDGGAVKVRIEDGAIVREINGYTQIGSAIPQPQDAVMLFTQQSNGLWAFSVDRTGTETGSRILTGYREVRVVRELAMDYLLFTSGEPWRMYEVDGFGNVIFANGLPGRGHQAIKTSRGTYLVSTADRRQMREFTRQGAGVRTIDGAGLPEKHNIIWFAGFDQLDDPNLLVVTNWLAPSWADKSFGSHVLAFTPENEILWTWDDHVRADTVTAVVVLEVHIP